MSDRVQTDMMIDLECAGPAPDGAIVSIGFCLFTLPYDANLIEPKILHQGRIPVDVQSCLDIGMKIDAKTMGEFWFKQPEEVRNLWGEPHASGIHEALGRLNRLYVSSTYSMIDRANVWAYPATYDLSILDRAYVLSGKAPAWGRQHLLCARSAVKALGYDRNTAVIPPEFQSKHLPENDAVRQAIQLQQAWKLRKVPG